MSKRLNVILFISITLIGSTIFYFFPDLDISLLTIKYHRFFLFHSVIIPYLLYILLIRFRTKLPTIIATIVLSCITFGISVHLITDIVPRKTVNFIIVNTLIEGTYVDDMLWIILNMLLGFLLVYILFKKYLKIMNV
jgi:hypothetical protein